VAVTEPLANTNPEREIIAKALWKSGNLPLNVEREWETVADAYLLDADNVLLALDEAGYAVGEKAWR
jgi:hypothetical protein